MLARREGCSCRGKDAGAEVRRCEGWRHTFEFPAPSVLSSKLHPPLGSYETSQSPHNIFMVFKLG